jgi:biotin carboxyl carrier protein
MVFTFPSSGAFGASKGSSAAGGNSISSPITGTIGKIKVKQGGKVKNGQVIMTLIAMKMENEIKATKDGKVKTINVKEGENVDTGHLLVELE